MLFQKKYKLKQIYLVFCILFCKYCTRYEDFLDVNAFLWSVFFIFYPCNIIIWHCFAFRSNNLLPIVCRFVAWCVFSLLWAHFFTAKLCMCLGVLFRCFAGRGVHVRDRIQWEVWYVFLVEHPTQSGCLLC